MGQLTPRDQPNGVLPDDVKDFIRKLQDRRVSFLIVGAYAVGAYGFGRATADIDLWFSPIGDTYNTLRQVLADVGMQAQEIDMCIKSLQEEKFARLAVGGKEFWIDLMFHVKGGEFEDCFSRRTEIEIDGLLLDLIGYEDLLVVKRAAKRPKDAEDIRNLKNLRNR